MKRLFSLIAGVAVGYWLVTKAAPAMRADLENVWAVYDDIYNWGDEW